MYCYFQEMISLSTFFLLGIFFVGFRIYKKGWRSNRFLLFIVGLFFMIATTNWIPAKLVAQYESQVTVCQPQLLDTTSTYYIHVLGAGYSLDPKLPATSQLESTTLTRLVEGIRIARKLPHYKLVTSAYSKYGLESQASVAKRAAIDLGIPSQNIEMLTTPSNTAEEVEAFVKKFGTTKKVIVVSDALHLPRAVMLYKKAGIIAIPAPSNFLIKQGPNDYNGLTFPSYKSLSLMNNYFRERLKYWKDSW